GRRRMESVIPPLLRRRSSDEYAPLPAGPADERAASRVDEIIGAAAGSLGLSRHAYAVDRRGTAATLRAIDDAHGGGFFEVPDRALHELEAADAAFGGAARGLTRAGRGGRRVRRRRARDRRADPPRRSGAVGRPGRGRARRLPED